MSGGKDAALPDPGETKVEKKKKREMKNSSELRVKRIRKKERSERVRDKCMSE